jgi:hypothetical protein
MFYGGHKNVIALLGPLWRGGRDIIVGVVHRRLRKRVWNANQNGLWSIVLVNYSGFLWSLQKEMACGVVLEILIFHNNSIIRLRTHRIPSTTGNRNRHRQMRTGNQAPLLVSDGPPLR